MAVEDREIKRARWIYEKERELGMEEERGGEENRKGKSTS